MNYLQKNMLKVIKATNDMNEGEIQDIETLDNDDKILIAFMKSISTVEQNSGYCGEDEIYDDDLTEEEIDEWYESADLEYNTNVSYSMASESIYVQTPDYTCVYPLKDVTNGGVDYSDFISREL